MEAKTNVPLEEALNIAGCGRYTYGLMVLAGLVDFAAFCGIQLMSVVIPAAGCDLALTTYEKGVLNSMVYGGMIFSSHLWGFLADSYGRRTVMRVSCFGSILVVLISSLAPNAAVLMTSCFVSGLLLSGIFTPIYVYVGECCPQGVRSRGLLITCAISSLATVYLPSAAWLIIPVDIQLAVPWLGITFTSWRLYIALLAVPYVWSSVILYLLPETPKYMLGKGMEEETLALLRRIYAKNHGMHPEQYPVVSLCLDSSDNMPEMDQEKSKPLTHFLKTILVQTKMIFRPPFLRYTVHCCMLNVGVVGIFNTILLWFPELANRMMFYLNASGTGSARICDVMADILMSSGNNDDANSCVIKDEVYIINIANGLLQSVCYYIFSFIAPRIGTKRLIVGLSALTTLSCVLVVFANNVILFLVGEAFMIIFLLVMFPLYISIVVDFFPTSLRTNATSIIMLCGRLASVVGSQVIGALYDSYCEFAYPGLTVLLVGMTVLFIILPIKRSV